MTSIEDEARREAAQQYPHRNVFLEGGAYMAEERSRIPLREAFVKGAVWRDGKVYRGCGHPNHGAEDHDCAPFLPDRDRDQYAAEPVAYALYEKTGKRRGEWVLFTHAVSARDRRVYDVRPLYAHPEEPEPSEAEVEAAGEAIWGRGWRVPKEVVRSALLAAQEVNRGSA